MSSPSLAHADQNRGVCRSARHPLDPSPGRVMVMRACVALDNLDQVGALGSAGAFRPRQKMQRGIMAWLRAGTRTQGHGLGDSDRAGKEKLPATGPGGLLRGCQRPLSRVPRRRIPWVRRNRQGLLFLIIAAFRAQGRSSHLSARSGLLALTEGSPHHSPKIDHLGQFAGKGLSLIHI